MMPISDEIKAVMNAYADIWALDSFEARVRVLSFLATRLEHEMDESDALTGIPDTSDDAVEP
jgi:hypothetical protein